MSSGESDDSSINRPEELIVDIYRQRNDLASAGMTPARVVISKNHYRAVQAYHARLGEIAQGQPDYIDRYRLFDLEICIEEIEWPRVEGTPAESSEDESQ